MSKLNNCEILVSSDERVARILSKEWFVNGKLNSTAFTLDFGESYLSVNRPIVETFNDDVSNFVKSHSCYLFEGEIYKLAILDVGDIRDIDIAIGETQTKIDVEVESRDIHTKSHAGIFTRYQNKNIKRGQMFKVAQSEEISADSILLEVRSRLLELSTMETGKLTEKKLK